LRLPSLSPSEFTPEQFASYEKIIEGPRKSVDGPLWAWLRHPPLLNVAQELGAFCRFTTSLPRPLIEIAVLSTAAHWKAGFEWQIHVPTALASGITQDQIDAIRSGGAPAFVKPDEKAVFNFCREILVSRTASEDTYRPLVTEIGETGAVQLVGILGYYSLVSMTIVTFELPLLPQAADPFEGTAA
jgi:4-carboxymuconolactone decarboxylase